MCPHMLLSPSLGREVTGAAFDAGSGYWTVTAAHSSRQSVSRSAPGKMHVSPPLTTPVEDKEVGSGLLTCVAIAQIS